MASVLVTGMSGTGKSAALVELARRGFRVVDMDSGGWSEWVRVAGDPVGEWLWREDRIAQLLASVEVILDRVENRTTNDYGKGRAERDRIVSDLELVEPLLRATCTHEIDTSRPLSDVVDALIVIGRNVAP
jgi:hypothetical protein